MSQLRDYLQGYVLDIQAILDRHREDRAIQDAAEACWPPEDPRYLVFIEQGQHRQIRLPLSPRGGGGSDERKPNETPNPKP